MENTKQVSKFPLIIPNFILKILALLTMTLDHIGYMLQEYYLVPELANVFRIIGRFALPLFCFMIVEGVLHTKSFKKYALRMGICLVCVSIALAFVEYAPIFDGFSVRNEGNIFIDLLLGATAVYCLNNKKIWVKFLSILPIAFSIGCCFANNFECVQCGREVWIIPFFLRTQYGFYGVMLILAFYGAYLLSKLFIKHSFSGAYQNTDIEQLVNNVLSIAALGLCNLIIYILFTVIDEPSFFNYMDIELQMFALISGVFILFYNGKRGYNAPWFKYGCYIYYALHMLIIYGLFAIIM